MTTAATSSSPVSRSAAKVAALVAAIEQAQQLLELDEQGRWIAVKLERHGHPELAFAAQLLRQGRRAQAAVELQSRLDDIRLPRRAIEARAATARRSAKAS